MRGRRRWYAARPERRYRAPVPVISVGNLSLGGTGKTPFAIWLLGEFQRRGLRPAYLSRGYGRRTQGLFPVHAATSRYQQVGDEALMVARRFPELPVLVCESRAAGLQHLTADDSVQVVVLDDAFQHLRVQRDLDLLMVDAARPPHRDRLLPLGRLREPLTTLREADLVVLNRLQSTAQGTALAAELAWTGVPVAGTELVATGLISWDEPQAETQDWQGKEAVIFSGLGNNVGFRRTVEGLGIKVIASFSHPDHHRFRLTDLDQIAQEAARHPEALLLCSEKDLMRLRDLPSSLAGRVQALQVDLRWKFGEEQVLQLLDSCLGV